MNYNQQLRWTQYHLCCLKIIVFMILRIFHHFFLTSAIRGFSDSFVFCDNPPSHPPCMMGIGWWCGKKSLKMLSKCLVLASCKVSTLYSQKKSLYLKCVFCILFAKCILFCQKCLQTQDIEAPSSDCCSNASLTRKSQQLENQ